jgi:hypothetical protein
MNGKAELTIAADIGNIQASTSIRAYNARYSAEAVTDAWRG